MSVAKSLKTTLFALLAASLSLSAATPALAQSQTHILKLDAKSHNQDNPVLLYLRAGTYRVTPIGRAQGGDKAAWSVWQQTNCTQVRGCVRSVPTRFTGLHTNYYVMSDQLGAVTVQGSTIPQVDETPRDRLHSYYLVNDTTRAFEVTQPRVYADEASALAGALSATFTLNQGARVGFALLDNSRVRDNRGGMSLKITPVQSNP
ncbi:MAG: hypothetical protein R3E95_21390 [Thiolinea sp.]